MPNRILYEKICSSETLAMLTAEEERFFYRLLVQCDDYGRFDGRTTVLRSHCFALQVDAVTDHDVARWLERLVNVGLIVTYEADDRPYVLVTTWGRYQQTRAKRSKFPEPPAGICMQMPADAGIGYRYPVSGNRESRIENRESVFGSGGADAPSDAGASLTLDVSSPSGKRSKTAPPAFIEPTDTDYAVGTEVGLSPDQVKAKSAAMLDHFRSKGEQRADWHAALRTWLRRSMSYDRDATANGHAAGADDGGVRLVEGMRA